MSPIPIGRTPGFLFKAIGREDEKGAIKDGFIKSVQKRLATTAREVHRSSEADLKEVHNLLQQRASKQDGPAAPDVRYAVEGIKEASMASNTIGCISKAALHQRI